MDPRCAASVRAAAAGRNISAAKLLAMDAEIASWQRELARQARQEAIATGKPNRWLSMTKDQQVAEAVNRAIDDLKAKAALKEFRAGLQVLKTVETEERIQQALRTGAKNRTNAAAKEMQQTANLQHAERDMAMAKLKEAMDAMESGDQSGAIKAAIRSVFDLEDPAMTRAVMNEIFKNADGSTKVAGANVAAKMWIDLTEPLRQRLNAAGGDVGKLVYGYITQKWDQAKVLGKGSADDAKAFADFHLKLVDRNQYVKADGSLMSDAEVHSLLSKAQETIGRDGDNKTAPGQQVGTGARANRGSDHRVIHFKDGDAWLASAAKYGEGSMYDAMLGHVNSMTRDIVLLERYGPNPEQQFKIQADIARRQDAPTGKTLKEWKAGRSSFVSLQNYWDQITGKISTPENAGLANFGRNLRNVETAAKITWGLFAAVADISSIMGALHYNRLPYLEMLRNVATLSSERLKATFGIGKTELREWLTSHNIIAQAISQSIDRFAGEHMSHNWSGRLAGSVMKLTATNAWTDGLRGAFSMVQMRNWARNIGKGWDDLEKWDRFLLENAGLTKDDWAIISKATAEVRDGESFLTQNAISSVGEDGAQQAASKWLAFLIDESKYAVIEPDLAARGIVTGGLRAGSAEGEAVRSVMQFKAFPIGLMTRTWNRAFDTPQGIEGAPVFFGAETTAGGRFNKFAALGAMAFIATLAGGLQTQIRQVLTGKDPIDMDPTTEHGRKFWVRSFAAGGGGGYIAEVVIASTDSPSYGFGGKLGLLGPVAGAAGGLVDVAKSNEPAAAAIRWAWDQAPYVDMWQNRALFEHWFLHNAQEAVNPGYLSRVQQRAQKDWGQEYWWEPGELTPSRAPDFAGAFGK